MHTIVYIYVCIYIYIYIYIYIIIKTCLYDIACIIDKKYDHRKDVPFRRRHSYPCLPIFELSY